MEDAFLKFRAWLILGLRGYRLNKLYGVIFESVPHAQYFRNAVSS